MPVPIYDRRRFMSLMVAAPFWGSALLARAEAPSEAPITDFGAIADGATVNTRAIQTAIDQLAARRGGTVVIPRGVMGWVDAHEYETAAPDPLASSAPNILAHMNADHVDSMILLARLHAHLEATEATMTSIDRLGFFLRAKTAEGMKGARINFLHEVATPEEARKVLVEMVRQARL